MPIKDFLEKKETTRLLRTFRKLQQDVDLRFSVFIVVVYIGYVKRKNNST
jgi:hypothetical protein